MDEREIAELKERLAGEIASEIASIAEQHMLPPMTRSEFEHWAIRDALGLPQTATDAEVLDASITASQQIQPGAPVVLDEQAAQIARETLAAEAETFLHS